jgi:hypothetical protein
MFGKAFIALCGIAAPTAYFMGMFGHGGIDRVVGKPPEEVRSALMDLDIRNAPGEPASDPSRSGGVTPSFELSQDGNDMVWTVMSGNDVAVRMIAHLEPIEGGTKTHVTASVQRGNAPDDLVAPAFRSSGTTLGLFSIVLDDELDDLTRPANADPAACQKIVDDFQNGPMDDQRGFGAVAKATMRLSALETKLKAAGCDTGFKKFDEPTPQLSDSGSAPDLPAQGNVSFEMGKPMVDVSKDSRSR